MRQSNGVRVMATPGGVMSSARFLTRAVSWRLKAAARFVRNRFGYDISVKIKRATNYAQDLSVGGIFNYFPYWHTKMTIEGRSYGGPADYATERISILNVPELHQLVDFHDKTVLELGPLEGGNTIKLCEAGVAQVVAIEGRVENYVKCCVTRNLCDLRNAHFILDDVMNISPAKYGCFDIAFCAGLLYHLDRPGELLRNLSAMTNTLVLATHYADEMSPSSIARVSEFSIAGKSYRGKLHREGPLEDPNSGLQAQSLWLFEEDLIRLCRDVGYSNVTVVKKNPITEEAWKLIYLVAHR
jgi:2-polyprenyl-3-methyl-5-hydroxy-6-metoxy-1,4-benzoquinol methylase